MAITTLCGFAYVRFGALPTVNWLLYGVKPVILGVVVQAIWGLLPRAAKTTALRLLGGLRGDALGVGGERAPRTFGDRGRLLALGNLKNRSGSTRGGVFLQVLPALPVAAGVGATQAATLPAIFGVFRNRVGALRQRLCAARVLAGRFGRAASLAHASAADRCRSPSAK